MFTTAIALSILAFQATITFMQRFNQNQRPQAYYTDNNRVNHDNVN